MPFKTILLHCNDERRLAGLIDTGVAIAGRYGGHVVGLSIVPSPTVVPAGVPGFPDPVILDTYCEAYRDESARMRLAFETAIAGQGVVGEWREEESDGRTVADIAVAHARAADLVIAAQPDLNWEGTRQLDVSDRLALESGRPVLVVPNAAHPAKLPSRIVVGWNGSREAARALFDALPFLIDAAEVHVVEVAEAESTSSVESVCETLGRYEVRCSTDIITSGAASGPVLIERAKYYGADLLIMGCYGHSRLRELVFGGATRYALEHAAIPVLMSH
jgi:nucleotide-binding universal stress UspA family protein